MFDSWAVLFNVGMIRETATVWKLVTAIII